MVKKSPYHSVNIRNIPLNSVRRRLVCDNRKRRLPVYGGFEALRVAAGIKNPDRGQAVGVK